MCIYIGGASCIYVYIFKLHSNPLFASQPARHREASTVYLFLPLLCCFSTGMKLFTKPCGYPLSPNLPKPPSESNFPNPLLSYLNWAPRGLIFCSTLFYPILPGIIHISLTIHTPPPPPTTLHCPAPTLLSSQLSQHQLPRLPNSIHSLLISIKRYVARSGEKLLSQNLAHVPHGSHTDLGKFHIRFNSLQL